jgi:ribonuclease D
LAEVVERCQRADELALDVESNGLHAYRAELCVLQLAWRSARGVEVAIVDCRAVTLAPLRPLLGSGGPPKVLHDVSFDAQLLRDAGLPLDVVRDTAAAACLLGEPATGLAPLAESWLGISLSKELQNHDWAERPLTDRQVAYLAGDVQHLSALADRLWARAAELDVVEEIAAECAYRLACALRPRTGPDERERYGRVKGQAALDGRQRAVLQRLVEARERIARDLDCPAFRVAPDRWLVVVARRQPRTVAELASTGRRASPEPPHGAAWIAAVEQGAMDEPIELTEPRPTPEQIAMHARKRQVRAQINRWRRAEAEQRGIDVQAVLPGHCAHDLAAVLAAHRPDDLPGLRQAIARIEGLGAKRLARYRDEWAGAAASWTPA